MRFWRTVKSSKCGRTTMTEHSLKCRMLKRSLLIVRKVGLNPDNKYHIFCNHPTKINNHTSNEHVIEHVTEVTLEINSVSGVNLMINCKQHNNDFLITKKSSEVTKPVHYKEVPVSNLEIVYKKITHSERFLMRCSMRNFNLTLIRNFNKMYPLTVNVIYIDNDEANKTIYEEFDNIVVIKSSDKSSLQVMNNIHHCSKSLGITSDYIYIISNTENNIEFHDIVNVFGNKQVGAISTNGSEWKDIQDIDFESIYGKRADMEKLVSQSIIINQYSDGQLHKYNAIEHHDVIKPMKNRSGSLPGESLKTFLRGIYNKQKCATGNAVIYRSNIVEHFFEHDGGFGRISKYKYDVNVGIFLGMETQLLKYKSLCFHDKPKKITVVYATHFENHQSRKNIISNQLNLIKRYVDNICVVYSGEETNYYDRFTDESYNVENKGRDIYKYYYGMMNYVEEDDHIVIMLNDSFVFLRDCPDVFTVCRYTTRDVMYMINSNQLIPHYQSYFISLNNEKARTKFTELLEDRSDKMVSQEPNTLITQFELEWPYKFVHGNLHIDTLFNTSIEDVCFRGNINFHGYYAEFVKKSAYPIAKVKALYHCLSVTDNEIAKARGQNVTDFLNSLKAPTGSFDADFYMEANKDVLCKSNDPRMKNHVMRKHFMSAGRFERRKYSRHYVKVVDPSFVDLFQGIPLP